MHGYTTWIGEAGLGPWGRSGLSGDGDAEEEFGVVLRCYQMFIFSNLYTKYNKYLQTMFNLL